ncbi:MAG TPA: DUF3306 domain-containing protein [Alphaproteobacteria bacterium]
MTERSSGGFFARWSRLKGEARASKPNSLPPGEENGKKTDEPADAPAQSRAPASVEETVAAPSRPTEAPELPPIEQLTAESDYSVFLREGVPPEIRRKALRKLWVSDPVLSAPDIFDVYCQDYHQDPVFPEGVKTLFKVGMGMITPDAEKEAESVDEPTGPPATAPASTDVEGAAEEGAAEPAAAASQNEDKLKNGPEVSESPDSDIRQST